MTSAFFCEVVHEKLWKSVNIYKSYSKKISGTFFSGHGVGSLESQPFTWKSTWDKICANIVTCDKAFGESGQESKHESSHWRESVQMSHVWQGF